MTSLFMNDFISLFCYFFLLSGLMKTALQLNIIKKYICIGCFSTKERNLAKQEGKYGGEKREK